MKREKILAKLRTARDEQLVCNLWAKGQNDHYHNIWPLLVSDELVVAAFDEDFQLNGYGVYAIDGIARVHIKDDKCNEFSRLEAVPEQLRTPDVACDDWQAFFASLPSNVLIGVNRLNAPADEAELAVGRVAKAGKKRLHIRAVDADAVWSDAPWKIRYTEITEVCFDDRYLRIFAKYAGEPSL